MKGEYAIPDATVWSPDDQVQRTERKLRRALLDSLYENLLASQLAAIVIALVLCYFFWDLVNHRLDSSWLVYMLLVSAGRITLGRFFHLDKDRNLRQHARLWSYLNLFGVLLSALGWGSAGVIFFSPDQLTHQILLVGVIAGVTAGSIPALSASQVSVVSFLVISILPVSYSLLLAGEATQGLGLLGGVYLAVLLAVGVRAHRTLRRYIELQIKNDFLIGEMTERAHELENWQSLARSEHDMALSVYESIMPQEKLSFPNVIFHLSSHSTFNGDILLIETRPDGTQHLLLGDFTGHGLSASLGAIPVADIFRSMTHKGFAIEKVISEINDKIYRQLPENIFLAACVAEIDAVRSRIRVWNAGLPSVYLLHGDDGTIKQRVDSMSPPLGIIPSSQLDERALLIRINDQDQLFMATDGVTEQQNTAGEMFGDERLEAVLNRVKEIEDLAATLQAEHAVFCEGVNQSDDLTFVVARAEKGMSRKRQARSLAKTSTQISHWGLKFRFEADAMRVVNPVPVINHLIQEFNNHNPQLEHFELALGELYKNALDHGVLQLDSNLKQTPEGYLSYYEQRDRRLEKLAEGSVEIEINNLPSDDGGIIELKVRDSGQGFDHADLATDLNSNREAHGRGVALVRALCKEVAFEGRGNQVRALYQWSDEEPGE